MIQMMCFTYNLGIKLDGLTFTEYCKFNGTCVS